MINADNFPQKPGVYLMKDSNDRIIYVGKASSLRDRVKSYFTDSARYSSKTNALVNNISKIEYIITRSELEALVLESSLIKKHKPKYNIMFKDDKAYPFLKLTINDDYPRLIVTRRILPDNARYFGPYVIGSVRSMLKTVYKLYPLRDCSISIEKPLKRACIKEQMKMCLAPCVNNISKEEYRKVTERVIEFLDGKQIELLDELKEKMQKASDNMEYEEAAKFRDLADIVSLLIAQSGKKLSFMRYAKNERQKQLINQALFELKKYLSLDGVPEYIEAFDISNFSGEKSAGSLVVFKMGKPVKSEYKRFRIKTVKGIDDVAMIGEIVRRRYERIIKERKGLPDLVLIDGGKGQLERAKSVLDSISLAQLPVVGLAKRNEYLFLHGKKDPIVLPKDSAGLHLLMRIRDEAHRFAVNYHKNLFGRKISSSSLDDIPMIGEKRKKILLRHYKSVDEIGNSSVKDIAELPGFSVKLAEFIYEYYHEKDKE